MLRLTRIVGVIVVRCWGKAKSGSCRESFAMAFGCLFLTVVCSTRGPQPGNAVVKRKTSEVLVVVVVMVSNTAEGGRRQEGHEEMGKRNV